jgi:cell division inhibitor SepF
MDGDAPEWMAERPRWGPEVVVLQPTRFEALQEAVQALRDHATVLLNLSALPPDQKQRAADFMAGGAFALDGQQERLGEQVFLFAPHFVQLHHD